MAEKEFKVLVTDLDGTLFYPKRKLRLIPKKSIKFLQDFIDKGNKLVIASGRNFEFSKKVMNKIKRKVDFFGCNSALMFDEDKLVYEKHFENDKLIEYLNMIIDKFAPSSLAVMTDKNNLVVCPLKFKVLTNMFYPFWSLSQGVYKEPYILVNKEKFYNILKSDKIFKVMIFFGLTKLAESKATIVSSYLRKNEKFCEASSSSISIELTPLGVNKGEGIDIYVKNHNLDKDQIYVIGDSGNDVPMFKKYYEHSFCMSHANAGVQKNAKNIIKRFSDLKDYLL